MPSLSLLFLFSLLSSHFSLSSANANSITLSLSPAAPQPHADLWQRLNHHAVASSARAHHLKHLKPYTSSADARVPLFPRGYGGYSISLSFGTPPQPLSFEMDTGSDIVWFPCTDHYSCSSCNFRKADTTNMTFIPKSSSSSKFLACNSTQCRRISPYVQCMDSEHCSYTLEYGLGNTTGSLLSETLTFPEISEHNFAVGCSISSAFTPEGIVGFGRGPESLPAQMRLKRFSYCMVSHEFDDNNTLSSDLVLTTKGCAPDSINYTPFIKNPKTSTHPEYLSYYYVSLLNITVGGVNVKVPYKFLAANATGHGGTIVDSAATFTFMEKPVFELVAREFENQVAIGKNYSREREIEKQSGLRPCFIIISGEKIVLPQLIFHFKGGAKMVLPLADYFNLTGDSVMCMTIVTNEERGKGVGPGPAIVLGNYQQQHFYMEYDLENNRLGFHQQPCGRG